MLNLLRRALAWMRGGSPAGSGSRRSLAATYDAAATTSENARHWVHTDALSARRANSPGVRKTLRERARYEIANNSYARGIVLTRATDLVGIGPSLQILTSDEAVNRQVERSWAGWAHAVRLASRLITLAQAKIGDGEGVGLLTSNPRLAHPVKLDVSLTECEQMTTPFLPEVDPLAADGIRFDEYGNPQEYHFLKYHPGDWWGSPLEYRKVEPRYVLHWFRADRPGQVRGIPEITPALPLFAQLRRFTAACLTAAETAASFAAVLETDGPADTSAETGNPFDTFDIERGMMARMPAGWKMAQFDAKHPAPSYEMFVWCLLREISRCLSLPLNVALGDSSKSNFSSARLDYLVYRQALAVERADCEREVLEPTLSAWLEEATRIPDLLPAGLARLASDLPHRWHWKAWDPIDALGEAQADQVRLESGTATMAEIAGAQGADWRERIRQQVREEAYRQQVRKELGLSPTEQEVALAKDAR